MDKKILAVHCYAAVELDGKRWLHMASSSRRTFNFELEGSLGVKVIGDRDTIIVPFSNVAAIRIEEPRVDKNDEDYVAPEDLQTAEKEIENKISEAKFKLNEK